MLTENQNGNGNANRLAWGLREVSQSCGLSVAFLRKAISRGEIKPTRAGRRVLIADTELRRWLGLNGDNHTEETQSAAA